jgi:demethylmenaquinone methyltransferase/2-methoxy-6-polyprenyl-1,4-benzoquinol methylase
MSRFRGKPQYTPHVPEHDRIYERPECQPDLRRLREMLTELLAGRRVLEIACGTGYWTEHVAQVAESVLAIDVNEDLLKLAIARLRRFSNTACLLDDAYSLNSITPETFDAGFAAFWWSHVPRQHLPAFLDAFHGKLRPGALVIFADACHGDGKPACRTDADGNTYFHHRSSDGTEHEDIRNYPTREEVERVLRPRSRMLTMHEFPRYWCATYQVPSR